MYPITAGLCAGYTRREWLRVGGLGAGGLMLPELVRGRAQARSTSKAAGNSTLGSAKYCILCFLIGGPAHQDIWDLKPDGRAEYRGEFQPIASAVPGIFVCEHIPKVARAVGRMAILRSVSHPDDRHAVAMHYMLTGQRHGQPNMDTSRLPTDFPTFGAVMQYLRHHGPSDLPNGISLNAPGNQLSANNQVFPGFFAGFLGQDFDPLFVSQDPSAVEFQPFPPPDRSLERLNGRRGLLAAVDRRRRDLDEAGCVRSMSEYRQKALTLLTSPVARRAFELEREPACVRDRYGWSPFGQGLLLARRLVEAGVCLVTVNWQRDNIYWDTHDENIPLLKERLLPPFDQAFSALLEDLDQRGLLTETMVVCMGEFGRSPKIEDSRHGRRPGRDHWAACNSVVFAGGGVRGGQVLGASDRNAAYPATAPVYPGDLAATIYHALGVDLDTEIRDRLGRPLRLVKRQAIAGTILWLACPLAFKFKYVDGIVAPP